MREPFQGGWNKCPVCGKEFRVDQAGDWLYFKKRRRTNTKYTKIYYCSWKCMRTVEKGGVADGKPQPDESPDSVRAKAPV